MINIIIIIILIICLWIFYTIFNKSNDTHYKNKFYKAIRTLYRQTARWGVASVQDDSELIRTLHANYATGYLWAIKDIISADEFKDITGVELAEFEKLK